MRFRIFLCNVVLFSWHHLLLRGRKGVENGEQSQCAGRITLATHHAGLYGGNDGPGGTRCYAWLDGIADSAGRGRDKSAPDVAANGTAAARSDGECDRSEVGQ